MPDVQQGDVYKILSDIKKQALGISDNTPTGLPGIIISFLPTGEPINPSDFTNPWKPNMTSLTAVQPPAPAGGAAPAAPGDPAMQDTSDIAKRYENLANTCTLVDKKLMLSDNYQAVENGASISQAWEIIIEGANVMPLPADQEAFQQKQRDKYLPRLRKTIKDEDGGDVDVDTKEYKAYKDYEKKYNNAVRNYANIYLANMSDRRLAQLWGVMGKTYVSDVNDAWDEWMSLGYKQFIEEAKDNLAAMGTDAAAHMIAAAKKKFEAYRVATSGVIPVTSQYVEMFPSNWAEKDNVDGWTTYTYDSSKSVTTSTETHTSAAVSGGFWFVTASGSYDKREEHTDSNTDKLTVSFSYALVEINRPWLDTLMFDLGNWFLIGNHPKSSISTGKMDQITRPDSGADAWLPIIPQYIFVIKNLVINASNIHDSYDHVSTSAGGGGSMGWGPFHLGGSYSHSKDSKTFHADKTDNGLEVHGAQILGWISHLVPMSPKLDAPKDAPKPEGTTATTPATATTTPASPPVVPVAPPVPQPA
jgi:hypothetical protein